jgi:hypothetical protein
MQGQSFVIKLEGQVQNYRPAKVGNKVLAAFGTTK